MESSYKMKFGPFLDLEHSRSYDMELETFLDPEHSQSCVVKYEAFPNLEHFGTWNIRINGNMEIAHIRKMIVLNLCIMRCYGIQITEEQSTQVRSLWQFNRPQDIIPLLIANKYWLSLDLVKMVPLLESVMQVLEDSKLYCISLSGSKSEFCIKPSGDYFNDTDLKCSRKGYIAVFNDSYICSFDVDEIEASDFIMVEYTKRMRLVTLEPRCSKSLQPIVEEAFRSFFSEYDVALAKCSSSF